LFKSWILRKIFGPKRDEITAGGGSWKLHKEELYDLYCPPNKIRMIKSKRMGCDGHVEGMGEKR
jgi:hypothetical protein